MSRRYFLGEAGEAAYLRLERSLQLGPDSGRALVASDSVDVRYEVRRRVAEILRVEVVRPGADVVERIHRVVESTGEPVLVWVEALPGVDVESEAWRQTYAALNMGRDVLASKGRLSLVLAGPVALEQQVRARAPDLVSKMRPMLVLGTRLELVGAGEGGQQDVPAHVITDVLAKVAHDSELAKTIAKRSGFPPEHLPEFKTAQSFWTDVVEQAGHGRIRMEALLAEAARQFQYNPELAELGKRFERSNQVQQDDLRMRLRRDAATKYHNHVIARMPVFMPKPLGSVCEAFVSLDFEVHEIFAGSDGGADRPGLRSLGSKVELEALVESVDPVHDVDHATLGLVPSSRLALAILGDSGSGKSTLCRWLAATIAEREPGRAPILVEAIDWMSHDGMMSLMDALVRAADGGSETVSVADLRGLCDEGRIVLLLDGYDEPVRARARSRMRDEIEAFSGKYPKVGIVVTSRIESYLEAPLPHQWQTLVIEPFDEGKLEDFVKRWYAMKVPDDPEARARGRAELTAALAAEPRAREMARNPLLATLIAELHHHRKAPLPGRRSELYGLVVELLLVTSPREREHVFEDMKEDDQRARLERFALWLQEQRSAEDGADIVFGREDFVREVATPMAGRQDVSRRGAGQWLEWLVRETGLVRETRDGRYSFSHLSLMEYLAGQGLLNRYQGRYEELGSYIGVVAYRTHWCETILLAVGASASDRMLVSFVVRAILDASRVPAVSGPEMLRLHFGLLMEDVELSHELLSSLLDEGKLFMLVFDHARTSEQLSLLIRYSRYGEAVKDWLLASIGQGSPEEAPRMAAACPRFLRPEEVLLARRDAHEVVPVFLDLSPVDLGDWSAKLPNDVVFKWVRETNHAAAFRMSLARLVRPDRLARLWSLAMLAGRELAVFFRVPTLWGKNVAILWKANESSIRKNVMPSYRAWRLIDAPQRALRRVDLFTYECSGKPLEMIMNRVVGLRGSASSVLPIYDWPWDFMGGFSEEQVLADEFPQLVLRKVGIEQSWSAVPADSGRSTSPNREAGAGAETSLLSAAAETHAARLMIPSDRLSWELIRIRLDNLFIHDFFDGLASLALERGTEHDCLPLLLALGLAQYQTTWTWPNSRQWREWFSSPSPADWLAAYFWHLCWAVGDVDRYPEHYAAAQACLDRADWPELAAELRAYTIRPMTVEEWQHNQPSLHPTDPPSEPQP